VCTLNIGPGHQHIDLIYFAKPAGSAEIHGEKVGWHGPGDWDGMRVNAEARGAGVSGRSLPRCRLRVGAVPAIAAVGTDELAVQPEHLRAANLAVFARGFRRLGGLLRLLFAHNNRSIRARWSDDTRYFSRNGDRFSALGETGGDLHRGLRSGS
jgi:hypothetical protein